ncbi:mannosyltransferase family protein [Buchananella hordeovulneris]|uniref:mannosyltransferase family protein n=1 Tax=Buchananella hordeovulneris TaxID=52770 RepID=UPI0026DC4B47|nr:mannosyltransferase family protein [Buchananella hordeovulneris]MDO5080797.1 mannosyltransferase family protein [Buchananella hordeovulneris]
MELLRGGKRLAQLSDTWFVVTLWALTRILHGLWLVIVGAQNGRSVDSMLRNWDTVHYLAIADNGYDLSDFAPRVAFFPGLPLVLRAGQLFGLSNLLTGVVLSAVCSLLAALALARLGGRWVALAWLVAPMSVFAMVVYTEAPFAAAAFWAWERARRGQWPAAAALTALACTLRVNGLFVAGAIGLLILLQVRGLAAKARAIGWLTLPAVTFAAYMGYLWWLTGNSRAWLDAQKEGWQREFTWPWDTIKATLRAIHDYPDFALMFRFELVVFVLGLLLLAWLVGRRAWADGAYLAVTLAAFGTSIWLFSVPRSMLYWWPLWLVIGAWVRRRPTPAPGEAAEQPETIPAAQPLAPAGGGWPVAAWRVGLYATYVVAAFGMSLWWARLFYLGQWAG